MNAGKKSIATIDRWPLAENVTPGRLFGRPFFWVGA